MVTRHLDEVDRFCDFAEQIFARRRREHLNI
jgi:hypothetical protein